MPRTTTISLIFIISLLTANLARGREATRFLISGGPLLQDEGFHFGVGVDYQFTSYPSVSWVGDVQYSRIPYRIEHYDGGFSEESGREVIHALLELKISPLCKRRISPYGLTGIGWAWLWRDAEGSMNALSNSSPAFAFAGGFDFSIVPRASLFTEVRLVIHASVENMGGELPLKIGLSVEF